MTALSLLYRDMLRIRSVEEKIAEEYSNQEMRCPVHLSIGQEAAAVGVCSALQTQDRVFSTHRCHAHYLARGGDLNQMIAEIYGKKTGCVGGRGGSMHLADHQVNFHASIPIIGSSIPLAVGTALSDQLDGTDAVSVTFFGDSTVEEGVFHESMNFAALRKLPVVFVCENNSYSIYTHIDERQPKSRSIEQVADAHGIWTKRLNGNDVLKVLAVTQEAVARCRRGEGPAFLVLDTFRHREHCGPGSDDHLNYRTAEEIDYWREQCPLLMAEQAMEESGNIQPDWLKKIKQEIAVEIDDSFCRAKNDSLPSAAEADEFVYA